MISRDLAIKCLGVALVNLQDLITLQSMQLDLSST